MAGTDMVQNTDLATALKAKMMMPPTKRISLAKKLRVDGSGLGR